MKLLPQYRSTERVHALLIQAVDQTEDGFVITPADQGYGPFPKPTAWGVAYNPQPGQYYVVFPNNDCMVMAEDKFKARFEAEPAGLLAKAAATNEAHREATRAVCEQLLLMLESTPHPPRNLMVTDSQPSEVTAALGNGWSVVYEYDHEGYYQHILRFIANDGSTVNFWEYPESDLRTDLMLWPDRG